MTPHRLAATLLFAGVLAACGTAGDEVGSSSPTATETTAVPDATSPRDVDPSLTSFVDIAVTDLAERLDVPLDEITVVSAEMVSWGDTSLGCPQPGMRYAQVVTDGTKIVLEHGTTTHDYHSGGDRPDPFLCEQPEAPAKEPSPRVDRTLDTEGG